MKKTKIFLTLLLALALAACALGGAALAETAPPTEPTAYVAQIGEDKYETLDAAIAAVGEGQAITLLADAEITVNRIDKTVVINGAGFTVTVPEQPGTETGGLEILGVLTFNNTVVKFTNTRSWGVCIGSDNDATGFALSFMQGTKCEFVGCTGGIYSGPGAKINVDSSELKFTTLGYDAIMGGKSGEYVDLNVTNTSTFSISGTTSNNGLNWVKAYVQNSSFTIQNVPNQASVTCWFTFDNANVYVAGCGYGFNSNKELNILNGSTVKIENIKRCGVFFYDFCTDSRYTGTTAATGGQSMLVDSSSSLELTNCGTSWSVNGDAESRGQSYSAAICMLSGNATCTFEEGTTVNIHDNACRAILNEGTVVFGSGTRITGNGAYVSVGGAILNEDSRGAGNLTVNSGAVIMNNAAKVYGGAIANGIYYNASKDIYGYYGGNVAVAEGAAVYNNHAGTAADDVYNAEGASLTLARTGSGWTLDGDPDCTHGITGWFYDGQEAEEATGALLRWNGETAMHGLCIPGKAAYYTEYAPAGATTGFLALKAAHGYINDTPYVPGDSYYTLTVRHVDEAGNELAATETSSHLAGVAYSTGAATIEGYAFKEMGAGSDAASGYMTSNKTVVYVYAPTTVIDGGETPLEPTPPVEIDPVDPPLDDTPKTGDAGLGSFLWLALCLSLAGLITLGFSRKRRLN